MLSLQKIERELYEKLKKRYKIPISAVIKRALMESVKKAEEDEVVAGE